MKCAFVWMFVMALGGCGSVTANEPPDGGAPSSGGAGADSATGSGGTRSSVGTGGQGAAGASGSGGAGPTCGANALCSDGICSSASGDPNHCGSGCKQCVSGQLCTNGDCLWPTCAKLFSDESCAPAGTIVHKDGHDCFTGCQTDNGVPVTAECAFSDGVTGAQASGIGLCVLACAECS